MYTVCYSVNLALITVVFLYVVFIFLHSASWLRMPQDIPAKGGFSTKVSVLIPARNEEKNIGPCITSILAQDYPTQLFEILVCDDYSEDDTQREAIRALNGSVIQNQYIMVAASPSNKKKAIEAGIKASSGELIILTDADCVVEKSWISTLVSAYEKTHANMLCGPVTITGEKNLCEKFQGLELCGLSMLSGAGINMGVPLLCNAANIAYTRKAFDAVEGFKDIDKTPSGDDILLMFKLHKKFPGTIHYVKSRAAMVYAHGQPTWRTFFQQRIRWASKGLQSNNLLNSAASLVVFMANFLPLLSFLTLFFYPVFIKIVLETVILKVVVDFLLLSFAANFFRKQELLLYYPIATIIVMLYTSLVGFMANIVTFNWKGRNY
jgi:cellulose synthase/poly-beta-1,6-N-acetylglucosamine synthase-like glycosyltransferase